MKYVLFVCNHNAGRSQMAQAFFERHRTGGLRAESAGSQPAAADLARVVVEAMNEVGHRPLRPPAQASSSVEMQLHADWAVTMGCGDVCPYVPTTVDDWDIPDPAGKPIEEVRAIRDVIEAARRAPIGEPRRGNTLPHGCSPGPTGCLDSLSGRRVRRQADP